MRPSRCYWNGTSALQREEITSKKTSFMCVRSIKVPIQKMSENLFNDPRILHSMSSRSWEMFQFYVNVEKC